MIVTMEERADAMIEKQLMNGRALGTFRRDAPARSFRAESPRAVTVAASPFEKRSSRRTATTIRTRRDSGT